MDRNTPSPEPVSQESIGSLLSGLIGDLQALIRGEVQLAKTELREDVGAAAKGAQMLGTAAVLVLVGMIVFMIGVALYIDKWLDPWIAFGLVGVVLLMLGAIAGLVGKHRLQASAIRPERTIESLKEDKEWASQQVKSLKN